jgi:diguanylate cyclase (GGDEF)-like protein
MVTTAKHENQVQLLADDVEREGFDFEKYEAKVSRFERLGIRLFSVSNCLVSFGQLPDRFDRNDQSMLMQEAKFCESLGFHDEIKVFQNLQKDENLSQHPYVAGIPNILFCVQHPIVSNGKEVVGNIYLIDYQVREFDDVSRLLLADLAKMVERELVIGVMKRQNAELQKQILHLKRDLLIDPVLGMWNRGAITRSLGIELERFQKSEKPLSILLISVDQYTQVKTSHGNIVGDSLLQRVVSRMRSCIRPFDALGRFENDVFLIVLPGASNYVAQAVAERIRLTIITHPETLEFETINISACIGSISSNIFPDLPSDLFINFAEKALHTARNVESNRIVQATPEQTDNLL